MHHYKVGVNITTAMILEGDIHGTRSRSELIRNILVLLLDNLLGYVVNEMNDTVVCI